MAAPTRDYRYSVEFNIHAVDAPGTRLMKTGDIYLNICLLGVHKRTRLMPPHLPMHVDQKVHFDKIFKFCVDPDDIIHRLSREHILIELIQNDFPTPILLASYETVAKDFLYPYSWERIEHVGFRRYVLLNRTIDFPGISPSLEFSTSPMVDDITGLSLSIKSHTPRRVGSPTWRPSSSSDYLARLNRSGNMSNSITGHTISSALKSDHSLPETREKLNELAIDYYVRPVSKGDKRKPRPPFVVRRVNPNEIYGKFNSGSPLTTERVFVNDYSLAKLERSLSAKSLEEELLRLRPVSPLLGRSIPLAKTRIRSPSPTRRSASLYRSDEFDRSLSPTRSLYNTYDDIDPNDSSRHLMSPTLHRESFRYRYRYSPASDLSDKVIHTLRRNLDSYAGSPLYLPYSTYPYTAGYLDEI